MNHRDLLVVFVAIEITEDRGYDGYLDCLKAAVKCSGAQVISISKARYNVGETWVDVQFFKRKMDRFREVWKPRVPGNEAIEQWGLMSMLKWFCVGGLVKAMNLRGPIFVADWDLMIFQNLVEAIKPFKDSQVAVSECRGAYETPTLFNTPSITRTFHDWLTKLYEADDKDIHWEHSGSMWFWRRFLLENKIAQAKLNGIINGSAFDHNIHCENETYEMDGETKKIMWVDKRPHFVAKETGQLVKANTIHCWGSYKQRTNELLWEAGLES